MNKVLLFNKNCQLRCECCHFDFRADGFDGYGTSQKFGKDIDYKTILDGLSSLAPYHIEWTGGEPTLYSGFKDLIKNLPEGCTWAITSNTLTNIDDVDLSKCVCWTTSDHRLDDPKNFNEERFDKNVEYLKKKVSLSISYVVTFKNAKEVLNLANRSRIKYGVRVNLLHELNPNINWKDTPELELFLSMPKELFNVVENEVPLSYDFPSGFKCHGSESYVCVYTDGSVFSCYSNAMHNKPLGVIGSVEFAKEPIDCYDECLGCSEDHKARIEKL